MLPAGDDERWEARESVGALAHRHICVYAAMYGCVCVSVCVSACVKKAFSSSERCEFKITVTEIEMKRERERL